MALATGLSWGRPHTQTGLSEAYPSNLWAAVSFSPANRELGSAGSSQQPRALPPSAPLSPSLECVRATRRDVAALGPHQILRTQPEAGAQ